jgi:uncharacterized glyoxalase superfamily protein PhnB
MAKPIPEGFHSLTPHIIVKNVGEAVDWYSKALGAKETYRMPGPGGEILHAEVKIGDSPLMLAPENPDWESKGPAMLGGTPVTLHLYVEDVDATVEKAKAAGAKVMMPPEDQFWGDRYGKFTDPYGHIWGVATHIADPSPEEIEKAMKEAFAKHQG